MLLVRGNCTGKKKDTETNKKGMGERFKDGEWDREVKPSHSIFIEKK